ncbi:MAG: hypothetical protein Kow0029_17080 [Candidatus Rifleibacteriota bacterium]
MNKSPKLAIFLFFAFLVLFACLLFAQKDEPVPAGKIIKRSRADEPVGFGKKLSELAIERTAYKVLYDGSYRKIKYPGGDVPADRGVCTDVVIRVYRRLGIDLQKEVHLDMLAAFPKYPRIWGLKRPDPNIDHRRVPNLQTFFKRKGISLKVTANPDDYYPGDLVTWMLPGNLPHIGIVTDRLSEDGLRPMIVHNIGQGPKLEDMLFAFKITGHYRYYGHLARKEIDSDGTDRATSQAAD